MIKLTLPFQNNNISLEPVREEHADIIYQNVYLNIQFTRLFRIFYGTPSLDGLRENIIARNKVLFQQQPYQEFLIHHTSGEYIGIVALSAVNFTHHRAEFLLGMFDNKPVNSRYSVKAALIILNYAFNVLKLNRLESLIYEYNQIAKQSTESLGFLFEGNKKEYIFSTIDQKYVDLSCYAMLNSDFRKNKRLSNLSKKIMQS